MLKRFAAFFMVLIVVASVSNVAFRVSAVQSSSLPQSTGHNGLVSVNGDPNQLVIGVNQTTPWAYDELTSLVLRTGGKSVSNVSVEGQAIAIVVDVPSDNLSILSNEVQRTGLARYVEPNMLFEVQFVPNDPLYGNQWALPKIQADWAWNTTTGNSSVLVAIIDTGIDYNHPDLKNNYVALGKNWVNNSSDPIDDNGHGTHVAGIIGAVLNNGVGIAGIAQVSIMAEKALNATGWGLETDLANAIIDAVQKGARILSNSWGGGSDSSLIHDAVRYAYQHGVLVLAAAGNSNSDARFYPAAYDEVVAVAATNAFDTKAAFSNWGSWIAVSAPGVNIFSTMPTYHVTLNDYPYSESMNYDYLSGTSMACPQAAGVAALIWSSFPNATRDWVRGQLSFTSDDLGDPGFDVIYGAGRVNARKAVEQQPLQHDLFLYRYDMPTFVQPGDMVPISLTVLNFGSSSESNVNVSILVDGTVVDSTILQPLASDSFATPVVLFWNPLENGTHNVTMYVQPVTGETIVSDNVISVQVNVQFLVSLSPSRGPVGTGVTVTGVQFTPSSVVEITFNDMFLGYAATDSVGDFTFTFNVPFSTAETWIVKAFDANVFGETNFTVVDVTPLNVQVDVGALQFRGEVVTFLIYAAFNGSAANATVSSALLYKPDGSNQTLTVQPVAEGLSQASYTLPADAQTGSYALVITAGYSSSLVQSLGTAFKSFLVSPTLSGWNAVLTTVNQTVGTIRTDLGLVNVRLDALDLTLARIEGDVVTLNSSLGTIQSDLETIGFKVTAINGTIATMETVLGTVNGTVTSIRDEKATIIIQGIGQVESDVSSLKVEQGNWTIPQYAILASTLVAAACALLAIAMFRRRRAAAPIHEEPKSEEPKSPEGQPESSGQDLTTGQESGQEGVT
ncbi:MAG: S8 family peptidase [Candidatus Bathyarchaeia archaeon]|jgi:thermitase